MALVDAALALRDAPARDLATVLAIMARIDGALGERDGVVWFNRLYLRVTEAVATQLRLGVFEDPRFVDRLDVVFANYCFAALRAYLDQPAQAPRAWVPLFDANENKGLARVQFALAGMNAHINRDLMRAVVDVCLEWHTAPRKDSVQKRDYDKLNPILEEVEKAVHAWYLQNDGPLFEEAGNLVGSFSLKEARNNAWNQAEGLWAVREAGALEEAYLYSVDKFVGFTSRSLLVPLPRRSCLGRILVRTRAAAGKGHSLAVRE